MCEKAEKQMESPEVQSLVIGHSVSRDRLCGNQQPVLEQVQEDAEANPGTAKATGAAATKAKKAADRGAVAKAQADAKEKAAAAKAGAAQQKNATDKARVVQGGGSGKAVVVRAAVN